MRKGFSLVEIMVVVVILGVLAGVGVPKLFGVIAKARASEVPVAAGTYVSLQNAYLHENNGIGSWKNIGYGAPGNGRTDYFEYSGCINGTIPFASMEPDMPGWQASNLSGLNSCKAGGAWAVIIDPAGEREIEYRQIITSAECAALTASWGDVGETVEGKCEATGELHLVEADNTPETPKETPEGESSSSTEENLTAEEDDDGGKEITECSGFTQTKHSDPCSKTAQGWEYVEDCGFFVKPSEAKRAKGLTVLGKKHLEDRCANASSSSSKKSSSSKAVSSESSANGSSASGSGGSGTSGSNASGGGGGTGGGSGGSSGNSTATSSAQAASSAQNGSSSNEGSSSSETPVIYNQNGEQLTSSAYEGIPDPVCKKVNGNCSKSSDFIPKEQCEVYNTVTSKCTKVRE